MLLTQGQAMFGPQVFGLALDFVDLADLRECKLSQLALVGRIQIEEFATCVGQAALPIA